MGRSNLQLGSGKRDKSDTMNWPLHFYVWELSSGVKVMEQNFNLEPEVRREMQHRVRSVTIPTRTLRWRILVKR